MTHPGRIRIAPDGSLKLPRDVTEKLGWVTGSYLEVSVKGDGVELKRIEIDLFAEAVKKPDADTFDKILRKQKESTEKAFKEFEVKIKDPPKLRPEDRPEFWD
jgi:bifunctional DNA-binding transcriptional regulator/antitoxin component of YhaV-PrlF toxin-antitoxin module